MDVMISLHRKWSQMLTNEQIISVQGQRFGKNYLRFKKTFEFRNRLPKNFNIGDKVYVYESKKNGGCGKVIGHFVADKIIECDAAFGAHHFISYFCRDILKNKDFAVKFERAVRTDLPHYKKGFILKFALDEESMSEIRKDGQLPSFVDYYFNKERITNIDIGEDIWRACDDWLTHIGFYNEFGENGYKYAIGIKDLTVYEQPVNITVFHKQDGSVVTYPPQSFMYVTK